MLCVSFLIARPYQQVQCRAEVDTLTAYYTAIIRGELDIVLTQNLFVINFHAKLTPDTIRVRQNLVVTGLVHGNPSAYPVLDHDW